MQFGFINILVTFQKQINSILAEYLDKFVIAYLDNIIIYLNSKGDYYKHVEWVLDQLSKVEILIVIEKCEFLTKKTNFIRFIIKLGRISIDLKKVEAIREQ